MSCGNPHAGDNLTGEGDGDDEQIILRLNQVPSNVAVPSCPLPSSLPSVACELVLRCACE